MLAVDVLLMEDMLLFMADVLLVIGIAFIFAMLPFPPQIKCKKSQYPGELHWKVGFLFVISTETWVRARDFEVFWARRWCV